MAFTEEYASILSPFVQKYKTANNGKARAELLKNAADAVSKSKDLREDNATELPKDLLTVCPLLNSSYFVAVASQLS
jgi:hypothetical protein